MRLIDEIREEIISLRTVRKFPIQEETFLGRKAKDLTQVFLRFSQT